MHHVQCYNMILKITFYQLKEFSKVQKNGLNQKRPFRAMWPGKQFLKIAVLNIFQNFSGKRTW